MKNNLQKPNFEKRSMQRLVLAILFLWHHEGPLSPGELWYELKKSFQYQPERTTSFLKIPSANVKVALPEEIIKALNELYNAKLVQIEWEFNEGAVLREAPTLDRLVFSQSQDAFVKTENEKVLLENQYVIPVFGLTRQGLNLITTPFEEF